MHTRLLIRTFSLGLMTSFVLAAGCGHTAVDAPMPVLHPSTNASTSRPTAVALAGVPNFGVVSAELWRGAKPTDVGWKSLQDLHVGTIIDLQEEDESAKVPAGVKYVPLRISGWHADQVDVQAVLQAIDANPKPVFIHCLEGKDRTGIAVAAYRLREGKSAKSAIAELNAYHVNFWWRGRIEKRIKQLAAEQAATRPSKA